MMKTLVAGFSSACKSCSLDIIKGQTICYEKGVGSWHRSCPPPGSKASQDKSSATQQTAAIAVTGTMAYTLGAPKVKISDASLLGNIQDGITLGGINQLPTHAGTPMPFVRDQYYLSSHGTVVVLSVLAGIVVFHGLHSSDRHQRTLEEFFNLCSNQNACRWLGASQKPIDAPTMPTVARVPFVGRSYDLSDYGVVTVLNVSSDKRTVYFHHVTGTVVHSRPVEEFYHLCNNPQSHRWQSDIQKPGATPPVAPTLVPATQADGHGPYITMPKTEGKWCKTCGVHMNYAHNFSTMRCVPQEEAFVRAKIDEHIATSMVATKHVNKAEPSRERSASSLPVFRPWKQLHALLGGWNKRSVK